MEHSLRTDIQQLERLTSVDMSHEEVLVALIIAKRVRRQSNLLVRQLAAQRDATAQEA